VLANYYRKIRLNYISSILASDFWIETFGACGVFKENKDITAPSMINGFPCILGGGMGHQVFPEALYCDTRQLVQRVAASSRNSRRLVIVPQTVAHTLTVRSGYSLAKSKHPSDSSAHQRYFAFRHGEHLAT